MDRIGDIYRGQHLHRQDWEREWAPALLARLPPVFGAFQRHGEQHLDHLDAATLRRVGRAAVTLLEVFDDPHIWGRQQDVDAALAAGWSWRLLCRECARTLAAREAQPMSPPADADP